MFVYINYEVINVLCCRNMSRNHMECLICYSVNMIYKFMLLYSNASIAGYVNGLLLLMEN